MTEENNFPILSLVIFLPLLGAILTSLVRDNELAKKVALTVAGLELIATFVVVKLFSAGTSGFQLVEQYNWIPGLNVQFQIGVDGISLLFLPASALLTVVTIIASWNAVQVLTRFHFALLLVLQGITIGVFTALDMVLFFLFWELTLPPIFFLIGLWGIGPQRRGAAIKYVLMMLFGGAPLLIAMIMLAINHAMQTGGNIPGDLSFSFPVLLNTPVPAELQATIFLLLVVGFAVKTPLVPLHTWLPTTAMEGPAQLSALLTGLKLGAFGILRFAMPLAPDASVEYAWILGIAGAITINHGALVALQQTNLRRMLAYSSVSHVGLVIVGISTITLQGVQGAVFQLLNFTLIASCMMLIAGFIQRRVGSTEIAHLGGLAKVMPRLTTFFFIFAVASMGIPGTSGFPAELLLITGTLHEQPEHAGLGVAVLLGLILGAAYTTSYFRRAFFGPIVHNSLFRLHDLRGRELWLLFIPAFLVLVFGFFPEMILDLSRPATESWLYRLKPVTV